MGHDVFLSYSTKDKIAAEAVCDALERKSVLVWMAPRDIDPASDYAASIFKAIDGSRAMVLMVSTAANDSRDVVSEVKRASDKRIPIVPFRIEEVIPSPSLAYFLGPSHYLNAFTLPMEPHYEALAKVVRSIAPAQPTPSGDVKPSPPLSRQRSKRLLSALVAGISFLVVLGTVAYWKLPDRGPIPLAPVPPDGGTISLGPVPPTTPPQQVIGRTNPAVPTSGTWPGFSQTATTVCPPDSFVASIQGFKSDTQGTHEEPKGLHDFISELKYTCSDRNGSVVRIGMTNPQIPESGSWAGFSGTGTTVCPPGSFVASIQGYKSDTQGTHEEPKGLRDFISELRYVCRTPGGNVVRIGKTNPRVPDGGSWTGTPGPPGFSGTGTTDCPQGMFINSIQAFKSDPQGARPEHNFISELRYTCA